MYPRKGLTDKDKHKANAIYARLIYLRIVSYLKNKMEYSWLTDW